MEGQNGDSLDGELTRKQRNINPKGWKVMINEWNRITKKRIEKKNIQAIEKKKMNEVVSRKGK